MLSSNIERNLKFSKGDEVVILVYKEKYIGKVLSIDLDRVNVPKSMYYVGFILDKYKHGEYKCKYYFSDYELEHTNIQKERDWRLDNLLKEEKS